MAGHSVSRLEEALDHTRRNAVCQPCLFLPVHAAAATLQPPHRAKTLKVAKTATGRYRVRPQPAFETGLSTEWAVDLNLPEAQGRGGLSRQILDRSHLQLQIIQIK